MGKGTIPPKQRQTAKVPPFQVPVDTVGCKAGRTRLKGMGDPLPTLEPASGLGPVNRKPEELRRNEETGGATTGRLDSSPVGSLPSQPGGLGEPRLSPASSHWVEELGLAGSRGGPPNRHQSTTSSQADAVMIDNAVPTRTELAATRFARSYMFANM